MDDLKAFFSRLGDVWGYIVAAVGVATSLYTSWRKWGRSVYNALRLFDHLHRHYGADVASQLVRDFTTRHKESRVSEARQRIIEKALGINLFVCSPKGDCIHANDELCELFGIQAQDMTGGGWLGAVRADERQSVHQRWEYCVLHSLPYEVEYTVVNTRTNETFWCLTRAYPIYDGNELLCYVGNVSVKEKP